MHSKSECGGRRGLEGWQIDLRASGDEGKEEGEERGERPEEADRVTGYPTEKFRVGSRARCGLGVASEVWWVVGCAQQSAP